MPGSKSYVPAIDYIIDLDSWSRIVSALHNGLDIEVYLRPADLHYYYNYQCCYQNQTFQDQDQDYYQCCYQDQSFQDQKVQDQDQDLASSNKVNTTTERYRYQVQYHHTKLISGDIKMHNIINMLVKYSSGSTMSVQPQFSAKRVHYLQSRITRYIYSSVGTASNVHAGTF